MILYNNTNYCQFTNEHFQQQMHYTQNAKVFNCVQS